MTSYAPARPTFRRARSVLRTAPATAARPAAVRFLRFAAAMAALCAVAALPQSAFFTVSSVTVIGARQLSAADVLARAGVPAGTRLAEVRPPVIAARLRDPRIAGVRVLVSLDGRVRIHVSERVPHAAVPYRDGFLIVDHTGVVMTQARQPGRLPVVAVDDAALPWVRLGDRIPSEGVRRALDLLRQVPAAELERGIGLRMDRAGGVHLSTADGIRVLLGHPRGLMLRGHTLPQVLETVRRQRLAPAVVDLRYAGSVIVRPDAEGGVRR